MESRDASERCQVSILMVGVRHGPTANQNESVRMQATVEDLQNAVYDQMERKGRYHPTRQRLTLPPVGGARSGKALERGKALDFYGIYNQQVIVYKDLGLQVRNTNL